MTADIDRDSPTSRPTVPRNDGPKHDAQHVEGLGIYDEDHGAGALHDAVMDVGQAVRNRLLTRTGIRPGPEELGYRAVDARSLIDVRDIAF